MTADFRIQLDKDEELGNEQVVAQDYDVPATTGVISIKPRSASDLMEKIRTITGIDSDTEAIGALQRVALPVEVVLYSPEDGSILKTLYIPDARFTLPGFAGRIQQKLTLDLNYESDSGSLLVYKGERSQVPGAPTPGPAASRRGSEPRPMAARMRRMAMMSRQRSRGLLRSVMVAQRSRATSSTRICRMMTRCWIPIRMRLARSSSRV